MCIGNIRRSPTAEYLLHRATHKVRPGSDTQISSSGLCPLVDHALESTAQEVLQVQGNQPMEHRARQLITALMSESDLILEMEKQRIIETADVALAKPVKPKKALIVLIATLLGALISIAFVLVRKTLNQGFQSLSAIKQLGLPVHASISCSSLQKVEEDKNDRGRRRANFTALLLTMSHPTDLAVESLRSLRTILDFAMMDSNNNRLMIFTPCSQVGRVFVYAKYKPDKA